MLDAAYARDALAQGELLSPLPPEKLDAQLTELYRRARSDLAEGGANTLFLALGFLSWRKSAADSRTYRAPLILLPVQLERRSVRSGVRLLLAIVRYNRLIDTFLGLTTYSLQNHLRTAVKEIGQIEIDELYIGLDKRGCHSVIPVQAKGGKGQIGVVQTTQDIRSVERKFPGLRCRAISAQFMEDGVVALFELMLQDGEVRVVDERHYKLVRTDQLKAATIRDYRTPDPESHVAGSAGQARL